jgi:hypothetical protein
MYEEKFDWSVAYIAYASRILSIGWKHGIAISFDTANS